MLIFSRTRGFAHFFGLSFPSLLNFRTKPWGWTWTSGVPEYAGFSFSLYKEGETIWTVFEFDLDSVGTTHVHNLKTANYYLEISEANINEWTITVEVWIPD